MGSQASLRRTDETTVGQQRSSENCELNGIRFISGTPARLSGHHSQVCTLFQDPNGTVAVMAQSQGMRRGVLLNGPLDQALVQSHPLQTVWCCIAPHLATDATAADN